MTRAEMAVLLDRTSGTSGCSSTATSCTVPSGTYGSPYASMSGSQ